MLEGKALKYQLTAAGDDQEGEAVPIALTDVNGDRVVVGGASVVKVSLSINGTSDPVVTEVVNTTGEVFSIARNDVGEYIAQISNTTPALDKQFAISAIATSFPIMTTNIYYTGAAWVLNLKDEAGADADPALFGSSLFVVIIELFS